MACICCPAPAVVHLAPPGQGGKAEEDYCEACAHYMVSTLTAAQQGGAS